MTSIRGVAASGGYYLAVATDEIFATPLSITGSIGIIFGKVSTHEALQRLSIRSELLASGPFASLMSGRDPFTDEQLRYMQEDLREAYRRFVSRVATGRRMSRSRVHTLGRGQVYMAEHASHLGLVDCLGGLSEAVDRACELAEVDRSKVRREWHSLQKSSILGLGGMRLASDLEALSPELWSALHLANLFSTPAPLAFCPTAFNFSQARL
ncbi:MAG: S49 family peptidase [Myxococcales bacterium]|nr:S49 family peptidase [Myxococcales bacterium]